MRSANCARYLAAGIVIGLATSPAANVWGQSTTTGPRVSPQELPSGSSGGPASQTPAAKPALSAADQTIKDAYQKSKTAATLEDYQRIVSLCQDGIDHGASAESAAYANKLSDWAQARVHNKQGEKFIADSDEKAALSEFEAAATLDPNFWRALHNRGVSRASMGDAKGAQADFDAAIKLNPNYANAWFNRAELKYAKNDFAGALDDYNRAIQLQPSDPGFYSSRGHAKYHLNRVNEAMADYNRTVQLDPNNTTWLIDRGDAYREQGLYQPAAADYRQAIQLNPKMGRAYLGAAWLMATCPDARFRETDKAISAAQKAIDLDGDKDYRYLDTLAAAQANAGQFDAAKKSVNLALEVVPPKEMSKVRQRLDLYESGRAYREGGPAETVRSASTARMQ
jgi:tetratricopeptide (TPR) repeat protein